MTGDMTEFFLWTEVDDQDHEGMLSVMIPTLPDCIIPLVTRNRAVAEGVYAAAAKLHHQESGHRVRLRRWTQAETLQEMKRDGS